MWNIGSTEKQKIGVIGEDLACRFFRKKGHAIQERNYRKKWGEIDIITEKSGILHFVEVKSVTREIPHGSADSLSSDTEVYSDAYRPEENLHSKKLSRLRRVIQSYLTEKRKEEVKWQLDLAVVHVDKRRKLARVTMIGNIV